MPIGRPLKFESPEAMQTQIDAYFDGLKEREETATITGLALWLDTTRETLCDYGRKDAFSDTVKKAKMRVEAYYEARLIHANATGPIFALKNLGWADTTTLANDQKNPLTKPMSEEEIDARILELQRKAGIPEAVRGQAKNNGEE